MNTPLVIEQGDTFTRVIVWTDKNGQPVDLTGARACMQLRTTTFSDVVLLELDTEDGGITIDGPAGKLTLLASAAITAALTVGAGVYDLQISFPDGTVTTILRGNFTLVYEVTRCL